MPWEIVNKASHGELLLYDNGNKDLTYSKKENITVSGSTGYLVINDSSTGKEVKLAWPADIDIPANTTSLQNLVETVKNYL